MADYLIDDVYSDAQCPVDQLSPSYLTYIQDNNHRCLPLGGHHSCSDYQVAWPVSQPAVNNSRHGRAQDMAGMISAGTQTFALSWFCVQGYAHCVHHYISISYAPVAQR